MKRLLAAALALFSTLALADSPQEALVEKWYAALVSIDRAAFETIIADDALISLGDLDIEQNKKEFIESLDEWQDAMKDASIRHKVEEATADTVSVIVCYTFPDNESLGREVFRFNGNQISESVQSTIGDTCAEY